MSENSFHGRIAIPLEAKASSLFDRNNRAVDVIYDADSIESGYFAEVMIILLRMKSSYKIGQEEIDRFVIDAAQFVGKSANEMERDTAQMLFDKFTALIEEK